MSYFAVQLHADRDALKRAPASESFKKRRRERRSGCCNHD